MIPENKEIQVKDALIKAFGTDSYEDIKEITIGLSKALIFRIVVKGKPYLMRIEAYDQVGNISNYYTSMKAGSEVGIAPRICYVNTEAKILITDFIEAKLFPVDKAKEIMPRVIKRVHKLPPINKSVNYFEAMDRIVQSFLGTKLIKDDYLREILKNYNRMKDVYHCPSEDLVLSHNDLKPENIIFDGNEAWLVDWEAAFLNDRYLDLAVVANFVVNNEEEEFQYLKDYFDEAPNEYMKARLYIMQQLLHVFYMSIFTLYASKTIPIKVDNIETNFIDFHKSMWEGKIDLSKDENKLSYALVHMNEFLSSINTKRFEEALKIVSK